MKRKLKEPVTVSNKKRLLINSNNNNFNNTNYINYTRRRSSSSIETLPNELIHRIFSYIDVKTLYVKVRPVCKRWYRMSRTPTLWKKINAANDVPTKILSEWIESSNLLTELTIENRHDANRIIESVSKNCKQLEQIKVVNCWGSTQNSLVYSLPMCHLIKRCHRINSFNFARTNFSSCKFFKLLARISAEKTKNYQFYGPVNMKQIKSLLIALKEHEVNETATIGNCNIQNLIKIMCIMDHIDGILENIWPNLLLYENNNDDQRSLQIII